MRILIIGAAGMIGQKLGERIAREGAIADETVESIVLHDIVSPVVPPDSTVSIETTASDLGDGASTKLLVASRPDVIFHLGAVLSGEAEADFDKGYRVNLDGTRTLFEAIRNEGDDYHPKVVFTSTIAVFGEPYPVTIGDEFFATPLTSYGTQKAMCELLLSDYSRRGIFDGIGIRLPTICVRPGKPNKAASGFFSNIIREPLIGEEAILPVPDTLRHWFASPRSAIGFLLHAASTDTRALEGRRNLTMPGVSATVGEQIDSLRRIAGDSTVALIRRSPDDAIWQIVKGWPHRFEADRAKALGFRADANFDEIIRIHIEDELGGNLANRVR